MGSIPPPPADQSTIYTIDDLVRQLGSDHEQKPLVAFPRSERGVDDYEYFSGRDINRLIDGAASSLLEIGLRPADNEAVVGIVSLSDLDFIINVFALGRLGYSTLIISPRLDDAASRGLLEGLQTQALLYTPSFDQKAAFVKDHGSLATYPIVTREQYDCPNPKPLPQQTSLDGPSQNSKTCIIMHSSGSTGKPRHILYPNKRLLHVMVNAHDLTAFLSVPLYHAHGLVSFLQALFKRKTCWLFNGNVPQTHDTVTAAIKAAQPEIVWTVPYVLKLLTEKDDGIDVLRQCKIVSSGGSRTPDELGDLVVSQGVHLGTSYGATEVAFVLTNLKRPREDKAWDYMAAPPHVAPFIWMKPTDDGVFELVVLDGHRGKIMSNSDDPPNSFHTKDLFIPHPSLKNRWKYVGRLDDRITLSNGEKFIPLDIEGRVRQSPLVKEAVVFGVDRPLPGLLIFKSDAAKSFTDQELIEELWPIISDCNDQVSAFGQVGRDYVAVLSETTECPSTDKQSIKRAQVYRTLAGIIDQIYADKVATSKGLKLDVPQLEDWLFQAFSTEIGISLSDREEDFFAAGVDSQRAIQMRRVIVQSLDLGESTDRVSSLVVFEHGNIARLSRFLHSLRTNEVASVHDEVATMESYIQQFSQSRRFEAGTLPPPDHPTVLVTGATGSLGSKISLDLISSNSKRIFCPVRAKSSEEAIHRLTTALQKVGMISHDLPETVVAFPCDLSISPLTIPPDITSSLSTGLTHIIHAAWPVNFSLALPSFQPHLLTLQNLYNSTTSVKTPQPAQFIFCSSIGTAMSSPSGTVIKDTSIPELTYAAPTGYARSKLVAERILEAAGNVNGNTKILRIGQIVPSTSSEAEGMWNEDEMIPLIIRSVGVLGCLPETPGPNAGDGCTWLPANELSSVILDLAGLSTSSPDSSTTIPPVSEAPASDRQGNPSRENLVVGSRFVVGPRVEQPSATSSTTRSSGNGCGVGSGYYNLTSPKTFSWREDFLPVLGKVLGQDFEIVSFGKWFEKLSHSDPDTTVNPSVKLLNIWSRFKRGDTEILGGLVKKTGREEERKGEEEEKGKGVKFETEAAWRDSHVFRDAEGWQGVLGEAYVRGLIRGWGML